MERKKQGREEEGEERDGGSEASSEELAKCLLIMLAQRPQPTVTPSWPC